MTDKAYRGIAYDDPVVQAQFEQLVQRVRDAEAARAPIAARHRRAEDDDDGAYDASDPQYIAANNAIAAAQHAVDAFLSTHRNYTMI
ncbi:MAG: hypothetical protein H7Z42_15075 [Roseiflexaceae bacterium]|nr:hypothetical protein [Roseiflexaceae bacterium]